MSISVQQMADRVAELMEARLRVRGEGLAAKLRRGGRHLPRKIFAAAEALSRQAEMAAIPRLQMQVDPETAAEAYDTCVRYLKPLGVGARRRALFRQIAEAVALGLTVTLVALVAVLAWRGFL